MKVGVYGFPIMWVRDVAPKTPRGGGSVICGWGGGLLGGRLPLGLIGLGGPRRRVYFSQRRWSRDISCPCGVWNSGMYVEADRILDPYFGCRIAIER